MLAFIVFELKTMKVLYIADTLAENLTNVV